MDTILDILKKIGEDGNITSTPYDTAWVARLKEFDHLSDLALGWLCENQLPDGSWGANFPFYYHDRVVCTLSAMIALTYRGRRHKDKLQIESGLEALDSITAGATGGLRSDPNGATVGFEMIVPTLIAEAEELGIIKQQGDRILGKLATLREMKMRKLKNIGKVSRHITVAHSAEMAGRDQISFLDVDRLQEENGSVACSPSATAYLALYAKPGDSAALDYLHRVTQPRNGGAPTLSPIEIFERVWTLWNISLTELYWTNPEIAKACNAHLDYIEEHWVPGSGLSFSEHYSVTDLDDTSVAFEVLSRFGRKPKISAVFQYEEESWFRCFHFEATPSIDVNIHVLGAFREAGFDQSHPSVQKALNFVRSRRSGRYWLDKWNLSPYYSTSHFIISARGYDDQLCEDAIKWIVETQKKDGSWGFFTKSTAEETAYCIQALATWRKHTGRQIPNNVIGRAHQWLLENCETPYPPLWIDKSLYSPTTLVESCILTALVLAEE